MSSIASMGDVLDLEPGTSFPLQEMLDLLSWKHRHSIDTGTRLPLELVRELHSPEQQDELLSQKE